VFPEAPNPNARTRQITKEVGTMRTSAVHQEGSDESELPCRSEDPELYFAESPSDVELAKAICQGCPVRAECLAGALERGEPWGVWGGELFLSGAVIPRKRPRGRPRKDAAQLVAGATVPAQRAAVTAA
jgi:WhiB family redox-sensing transcriptional regulator